MAGVPRDRWPVQRAPEPGGSLDQREYTKDEILWYVRTQHEGYHRWCTYKYGHGWGYRATIKYVDGLLRLDLPDMTESHLFVHTCNKSVPVYLLPGGWKWQFYDVLHNYIYRRWFRPYRSEIGYHRFICKFILAELSNYEERTPSQATVDAVVLLNSAICADVEARHREYDQARAAGGDPLFGLDHRLCVLQPLFKALLIIVCSANYRDEDSKVVGRLPVFLVRTGIEDGLSAPITFESIADKIEGSGEEAGNAVKTTLETAIDFVISLEAREAAAVGLQPDPVAAYSSQYDVRSFWGALTDGEVFIGPSSRFVDTEKFPEWMGYGESLHSFWDSAEQEQFRKLEL